jgi:hypothetical protein
MVNPAMFCGLRSYKEVERNNCEINESQHFPGGTEENNRNLSEKILVMGRDPNPKLLAHETRLLAAPMRHAGEWY